MQRCTARLPCDRGGPGEEATLRVSVCRWGKGAGGRAPQGVRHVASRLTAGWQQERSLISHLRSDWRKGQE